MTRATLEFYDNDDPSFDAWGWYVLLEGAGTGLYLHDRIPLEDDGWKSPGEALDAVEKWAKQRRMRLSEIISVTIVDERVQPTPKYKCSGCEVDADHHRFAPCDGAEFVPQ